MSSSRPGPSPTKTNFAFGFPSANTILFLALCSLHRVQSPMSSRIFNSESPEIFDVASNNPDFGADKTTFGGAGTCNAGAAGSKGFRGVLGTVSSSTGDSSTEGSATTATDTELIVSLWLAGKSNCDDAALAVRLR